MHLLQCFDRTPDCLPHLRRAVENVHVGSFLGKKGHLKYRTRAKRIYEALGVAQSGIRAPKKLVATKSNAEAEAEHAAEPAPQI